MANHEPKHPPANMAGLDGLIERLRAIPVWMVEAMTPGWQTHGTAAYEATTQLQALAARVKVLEAENERLLGALRVMIYETTHLSPMEPDGSHWCRITADALNIARAALEPKP